jgi:hypothetical protein
MTTPGEHWIEGRLAAILGAVLVPPCRSSVVGAGPVGQLTLSVVENCLAVRRDHREYCRIQRAERYPAHVRLHSEPRLDLG